MDNYHLKLKKFVGGVFLVSLIIMIISILNKDRLPGKEEILDELYNEPLQTEISMAPFTVEKRGVAYLIKPLFNYELYGMVVTYHHSYVWWDTEHKDDFINTKDICVIWGDNIASEIYKKMKFSSGSWTCYYDFSSGSSCAEAAKFRDTCLSNNHVLLADDRLNRLIMDAERGDQIYIKGYLVSYTQPKWGDFERRSSTTRKDNLCEVIYVTDFKILKKANYMWRLLYKVSKYMVILCVILLALMHYKDPRYSV